MTSTNARLRRLVSSGICQAPNAATHAAELKRLGRAVRAETRIQTKERFFKALGDATRLRIVRLLAEREMCVCELMVALDATQPTASHHLGILEREGIVRKRHEGKWVLYRLASARTASLIDAD